jgi:hypothetical protein
MELAAVCPYIHIYQSTSVTYSLVCELERKHIWELASIRSV